VDLTHWNCYIPGKKGTIWENGHYPLTIKFSNDYPAKPPKVCCHATTRMVVSHAFTHRNIYYMLQCSFDKGFYHPNIYPSGTVCLSILNEDEQWRPSITLRQILIGIQDLLDTPNEKSPAQSDAYMDYTQRRRKYEQLVKAQVKKYPSPV
jgi:ubiquitin-conjugating enzyme E2 I